MKNIIRFIVTFKELGSTILCDLFVPRHTENIKIYDIYILFKYWLLSNLRTFRR